MVPCALVLALAALFRIVLPIRTDVFLDETYYVDLSTSLRQGHYPPQFQNEGVFLLHPPLFFLFGGAWQWLERSGGNYFQLVDSMRLLEAIFAVATAGLIFLITRRLSGSLYGLAAGVLFSIEPYILRENGRVLLETPALAFVMAGYFLLFGISRDSQVRSATATPHSGLRSSLQAVCAGLVLGLGIVTLEITAIVIIGPLLVLIWRRWCFARRFSVIALLGTIAPYGAFLVSLGVTHHFQTYAAQIELGFKRILGYQRESGFTRSGAPSLVHSLTSQISSFGTTYLLVAFGVLAAAYLLFRGNEDFKLIGVVVLFAAVSILYDGLFGTLEEQFLYVLLVPTFIAVASAAFVLNQNPPHQRRLRVSQEVVHRLSVLVGAVFVAMTLYDIGAWAIARSRPDDGLARVVAYLKKDVPDPGVVASNALAGVYVLGHNGIRSMPLIAPGPAASAHVRYFVLLSAELPVSYGFIDAQQALWYEARGRVVFSFAEPTYGRVVVYETTNPAAW